MKDMEESYFHDPMSLFFITSSKATAKHDLNMAKAPRLLHSFTAVPQAEVRSAKRTAVCDWIASQRQSTPRAIATFPLPNNHRSAHDQRPRCNNDNGYQHLQLLLNQTAMSLIVPFNAHRHSPRPIDSAFLPYFGPIN